MSNDNDCDSSGLGEGEADDELVVEGRRSARRASARQTSSSKQKQRQALETLRQARTEGRVHRPRVSDLANEVYEEMTEQEYQERKARQREFVERDGSGYYVSSDEEDDAEGTYSDDDAGARASRRNGKRRGGKHADQSLKRARPSGPTITSLFRSSTSKKNVESEEAITLEDDDYLKECLAGITGVAATPTTTTSSIAVSAEWDVPARQSTRTKSFESFPKPRSPVAAKVLHMPSGEEEAGVSIEGELQEGILVQRNHDSHSASTTSHQETHSARGAGSRHAAPSAVESAAATRRQDDPPPETISSVHAIECMHKGLRAEVSLQNNSVVLENSALVRDSMFDDVEELDDNFDINNDQQQHTTKESMGELKQTATAMGAGSTGDALRFYWIDAFEDSVKHPGTVYLFGRIRVDTFYGPTTKSCCLVVRSVRRRVYFVKRDLNRRDASEVTLRDVQVEVEHRLREAKVAKFKSVPADAQLRYLVRDRKQRFGEKDELLEVQMESSAAGEKCPRSDWEGNTYASVLNTTTTALERILTECSIKGPCWLDVSGAVKVGAEQRISHCPDAEYIIDAEEPAGVLRVVTGEQSPPPPVTMAAFSILTAVNEKENERQIVMVSMLFSDAFPLDKGTKLDARKMKRFCLLTKLQNGVSLPFNLDDMLKQRGLNNEMVRRMPDERSLLNCLLAKLANINPDLLMAHDLAANLQLLRDRISKYNLTNWHQLGRLRRSVPLKSIQHTMKQAQWELTAGRVCLDAKVAAAELMHARSYEQEDLVEQILKPVDGALTRLNLSAEAIASPFNSSTPQIGLIELMEWSWKEVFLTLRIVNQLNAVPLFLQITQIVGGVLSRTMMGGRADRNDYLLLHACYKNKYIAPDKYGKHGKDAPGQKGTGKAKTAKRKRVEENGDGEDDAMEQDVGEEGGGDADPPSPVPVAARKKAGGPQYSGGLVLEPKKGLYHTCIILLDFNSLYPSIIQEYNICFTTVSSAFADVDESDLPPMPESGKPEGILKREIRELVNRRREVKSLMQKAKPGSEQHTQYHIRQMGLKLTANSMYGCLGFEGSRFFAKTLAAMITAKGREILMHAKQLVEAEGHSVIYGDTDSLMINTNKDDVAGAKAIGIQLKQSVNKNYRLLELDIDGIYKRLLLLKKKKYAALAVVDINGSGEVLRKEMKGLDIVRRDWSEVAKEVGEEVLELILRSTDRDRLAESVTSSLRDFRNKLNAGQIPIEKFAILKQLHKNPEDEGKRNKNQPHILVALRLNETKKFRFRPGDIVPYIICDDKSSNSLTQRAYHLSELVAQPELLSLDVNYYLNNQVLPVVSRLCEPIDELDTGRIADALGLDSKRYAGAKRTHRHEPTQATATEVVKCLEEDFSACEGFQLQCECGQPVTIRKPIEGEGSEVSYAMDKCQGCSRSFHSQVGSVLKQLVLALKAKVVANSNSPYKCEDVVCAAQIDVPHPEQFTNEGVLCHQCGTGSMRKEHPDGELFHQLCFFKTVFDVQSLMKNDPSLETHLKRRPNAAETREVLDKCLAVVERYLKQNDFNRVDLSKVSRLFASRKKGRDVPSGGVLKGA